MTKNDTKSADENKTVSGIDLRKKRSLVFHFLYAMDSLGYDTTLDSVIDNFNRGFDLSVEVDGEIAKIVQGIIANKDEIDVLIKPFLENWRIERIGCCTMLILRYACWELLYTDMPVNIVINEAIELSKGFCEKDAYKFVNGVLDEVQKALPDLRKQIQTK